MHDQVYVGRRPNNVFVLVRSIIIRDAIRWRSMSMRTVLRMRGRRKRMPVLFAL